MKNKIYESAKSLFYEYGFASTTIQKIAQKAGSTLGCATYHYNTKEKFVSQIFSAWNDRIYLRMNESEIGRESNVFKHFVLTFNYHREILEDENVKRFYLEIIKKRSLYTYLYSNLHKVYYGFVNDFAMQINRAEIENVIIADFGARREFMLHICTMENRPPIKDISTFVFSNTLRALGLPADRIKEIADRAYEYYINNPYTDIKLLK